MYLYNTYFVFTNQNAIYHLLHYIFSNPILQSPENKSTFNTLLSFFDDELFNRVKRAHLKAKKVSKRIDSLSENTAKIKGKHIYNNKENLFCWCYYPAT